jgi:hypothetical protein
MMNQEIVGFLKAALECSVLVSPLDPGLTATELLEIGKRAGYQSGEINDALRSVTTAYFGTPKMRPSEQDTASWVFLQLEEPEYRNFAAFDFVVEELNALTRAEGGARAAIAREVIVERAISKGIPRNDIEVAITWQVMSKQLSEKDGVIRFSHPGVRPPPSDQLHAFRGTSLRKPNRGRAYPLVKDVIERRSDGRPSQIEPLDAFAEELDKLGYASFRLWWKQTVTEMRLADPSASPVSISVLAAALIEGALTFIVSHARKFGAFQSSDYAKDPRTWKIDGLVASAASGGSSAILNPVLRARADAVIQSRQRIHAGRMLSEFPGGPPDIRPEEARNAKTTAEQVVRAALDWLQLHPPAP